MEEDMKEQKRVITTKTTTTKVTTTTKYEKRNSVVLSETAAMSSNKLLYGKDLAEYDDVDVEELLDQLTTDEIELLSRDVDPDDDLLPPSQRCGYFCRKEPTGPLDRKQLIEHINKEAIETPDKPEMVPYEPGKVRGKKWIAPECPKLKKVDEQIRLDMGDEYEQALSQATEDELVDLAAILGFHSMMNQDQYHASLLNKGQPGEIGWGGITKATKYKPLPPEPENRTDPETSIQQIQNDDADLTFLCWNNLRNISDEKFDRLFESLKTNTRLEALSLSNVGLNDRHAKKFCETLEKNAYLRIVNLESNFITPPLIRDLIKALLVNKSVEEFRIANQKPEVLGNKVEMDLTHLIEQNPTILRLGLHFEYNDARNRVAVHLQNNRDKLRIKRISNKT